MAAATAKATEVKKPKTFWMRTREECMSSSSSEDGWRGGGKWRMEELNYWH
jgi:hypothetical protein